MGELEKPQSAMLLTEDEWESIAWICRRYIAHEDPAVIDPDCVMLAMRIIEASHG